MNHREEVQMHGEKTWVLCLGQSFLKDPLTPLVEMVDWYNNQLLTKCLLNGQISLKLGDKTLMATSGLLPAEKLLIVGLGESAGLTPAQAKRFMQDLGQTLDGLNEKKPWIVMAADTPVKFLDELKKSRTSSESLSQATISIG